MSNKNILDLTKLTLDLLEVIDRKMISELFELWHIYRKSDLIRLVIEFLTLKVFDENRNKDKNQTLEFYILPSEIYKNGFPKDSFKIRINQLYKNIKQEYKNILCEPLFQFQSSSDNKLFRPEQEKLLVKVVETFQKNSILKSDDNILNQILDRLDCHSGILFTPTLIAENIIKILNPQSNKEFCDPSCRISNFLIEASKYADSCVNYYGFNFSPIEVKFAELNLVLNKRNNITVHNISSLSQKLLNDKSISNQSDFSIQNYNPKTWNHLFDNSKNLKKYKIVATCPYFGKDEYLQRGIADMYETYTEKAKKDDGTISDLPSSIDVSILFLEKAYKSLEDGGRMAIILPDSILISKNYKYVRKWFFDKVRIIALCNLPDNTFNNMRISTAVIIAYKPKTNEQHLLEKDYEIYTKSYKTLDEFDIIQNEFQEYLKNQESEIKLAFHCNK